VQLHILQEFARLSPHLSQLLIAWNFANIPSNFASNHRMRRLCQEYGAPGQVEKTLLAA